MNDQFDPFSPQVTTRQRVPITISPIFGLILLITIITGVLTYLRVGNPRLMVFLFVMSGWIVSLCLHEFGHALVAYLGGDKSVVGQGYLSLNPLKYTHGVLSIVMPLIFLALGGIGLPGGAVYINMGQIPSKRLQSLTSAAGPIATALCGVVVSLPFILGLADLTLADHPEFWAGLAFLGSLEFTALLLNLIPIPGLDGFGIIAPFLPDTVLARIRGFGSYTLLILFVLFFNPTFNRIFWSSILFITGLLQIHPALISQGLRLFQFWE
jgi:Zn-dependent protease